MATVLRGGGAIRFQRWCPREQHLRDFSVAVSQLSRNDRFLANIILRHKVPKILVHGKENHPVKRTRCFTSFSMTFIGGPRRIGMAFTLEMVPS